MSRVAVLNNNQGTNQHSNSTTNLHLVQELLNNNQRRGKQNKTTGVRKSSLTSYSQDGSFFYAPRRASGSVSSTTMPLSRTRSLLANINGVASGTNNSGGGGAGGSAGSSGSGNGSGSSAANTPNESSQNGGYGSSYLPSISNGEHDGGILPPLKSGSSVKNSGNSGVISTSSGGILFNGGVAYIHDQDCYGNGKLSLTSNGYSGNGSSNNRNHLHSHHGVNNKAAVDLDTISTSSSVMSATNTTGSANMSSGNTSNNPVTNGHSVNNGSNSNSIHMNGMQTLPMVRHSTSNSGSGSNQTNGDVQNGVESSPKHLASTTITSATATNVINSNNAATSQNGGSLKPKIMVATPEQVMKLYMNKLTPYEHHEIFSYPQIYFIGANAKKRPGIIGGPNNCGYDDEQGSYTHIAHDHLAYRYEVLKVIGKGSFGQVVKAYDHKNHHHVALKMVRNEKRFHRQAQEEIRILEHLRKQDKDNSFNIIHMYDHFNFRSHTCITFELLSINLYELIKKNKFQGFSLQLVRKFAHSLLQCLDLLYRNKIIHCDMKPENVLLKQQGRSGIKVSFCVSPMILRFNGTSIS